MAKTLKDSEILKKVNKALNYESEELGLKAGYWIGDNNCNGMDTTNKPQMPLCNY